MKWGGSARSEQTPPLLFKARIYVGIRGEKIHKEMLGQEFWGPKRQPLEEKARKKSVKPLAQGGRRPREKRVEKSILGVRGTKVTGDWIDQSLRD